MWYSALEVAKYVITRCSEAGNPISNLKLQKMLYFLWVEFYRQTGRTLFYDDICAWQFGPVVPDVYYEYCSYAGRPINVIYPITDISPRDRRILDGLIDEYMEVPVNTLINRTHSLGTAWDLTYRNGMGNRRTIPFDLIRTKER